MPGIYLNPDEMELEIRGQKFLDFTKFGVRTTGDEVLPFFQTSPFLMSAGLGDMARRLTFSQGRLEFGQMEVNSYFASVASDFIRQKLLGRKASFTLETVMSHESKVRLLAEAQVAGYGTYLYFVATNDPAINIARVKGRVLLGGHAGPED